MWGAVVSSVALGVSIRLSLIHFVISAAILAMIVHVMLVDKKLDATLRAIDVLHRHRAIRIGRDARLHGYLLLRCARLADPALSTWSG